MIAILLILACCLGTFGCDHGSNESDDDSSVLDDDDSSGGGDLEWWPDQQCVSSDCGGFTADEDGWPTDPEWCTNEMVKWSYDAVAQELWIQNSRIYLNCCGDHGMIVGLRSGSEIYVLETDDPIDDMRCGCDCFFDFSVTVESVPESLSQITIERTISDYPPCSGLVWSGAIDLAEEEGQFIIENLICGENDELSAICEFGP